MSALGVSEMTQAKIGAETDHSQVHSSSFVESTVYATAKLDNSVALTSLVTGKKNLIGQRHDSNKGVRVTVQSLHLEDLACEQTEQTLSRCDLISLLNTVIQDYTQEVECWYCGGNGHIRDHCLIFKADTAKGAMTEEVKFAASQDQAIRKMSRILKELERKQARQLVN